jgi:hypothetical protein
LIESANEKVTSSYDNVLIKLGGVDGAGGLLALAKNEVEQTNNLVSSVDDLKTKYDELGISIETLTG